ncbi:MAG TPA: hypothetical protein VFC44_25255, partial [Candidatus Saccharimonadales bacterium]|nr:hypothetical protein [Candidatus Saccharimonadales bacterium]
NNNPSTGKTFAAAQIAAALGRSRQSVRRSLFHVESVATTAGGNEARAWSFEAMPAPLRADLLAIARNQGHRDVISLLSGSEPDAPDTLDISDVSRDTLAAAAKLRAVLEPFLRVKDTDPRTQADFEADGIAAYQRVFRHPVSGRWFRELYNRTVQRDNNRHDWLNLALYLPDNISARPRPKQTVRAVNSLPEELADTIKTLENAAAPTGDDRKFLFDAAFRQLGQRPEHKSSIVRNLFRAVPGLAKTEAALKRSFNRKYAAWQQAGADADALEDRRRLASGNFRKPDFSADQNKIRDLAILHNGNTALAYRKLRQAGDLSEGFVNYYHFDARKNKSYLPANVRNAIAPDVAMCGPIHQGPWKAKMAGPYIPRDWSAVHPGDWYSGDDVTWNNYFYFHDEAGLLHIERGECLVLHDLRTGYILGYVLIAGKYNSRHIRRLILQAHDTHGLPHDGFYFERGVWKARIIRDLDARENFHWRETANGLDKFNLKVRHATTPRAKTIEGLIRILQERQRNEPGFVGFNERTHEMERMQDFLARARRGRADPSEQLLSMEQWSKRLDEIFSAYNRDPQNGKMLQGQTPEEMWQAGLQTRPLRQLPEEARYILATHCRPATVHQQGIILSIGGDKKLFCGPQTGPLIGQKVLTYYNLDCPDLLTVSDLNRHNYFTMKAVALPALAATKEQFAQVHAQISGHRQAAKTIYGNIRHNTRATIVRDTSATEETKELGRFHNAETEKYQIEQTATNRTLRKIQTAAAAAGIAVPAHIRHPDIFLQGVEGEIAIRREMEREASSAGEDANGKKEYILTEPPAAAQPTPKLYFSLWAQIEKQKPGATQALRHALTQKTLGGHPKVHQMTPEQLGKMIRVFSAILRDLTHATS